MINTTQWVMRNRLKTAVSKGMFANTCAKIFNPITHNLWLSIVKEEMGLYLENGGCKNIMPIIGCSNVDTCRNDYYSFNLGFNANISPHFNKNTANNPSDWQDDQQDG